MLGKAIGRLTNFSNDTGEDDVLFSRSLYGGAEFIVVPSVNFALTVDDGSVWVEGNDFSW